MTHRARTRGHAVALAAVVAGLLQAPSAVAGPLLPDFDRRGESKPGPAAQRALAGLVRDDPGILADLDPGSGGVSFLVDRDGYLTGPSGRAPGTIVRDWLLDNRAALGLDREDVDALGRAETDRSPDGIVHLVQRQESRGVPSFDSHLKAAVTNRGRLVSISGAPVGDFHLETIEPAIGASEALRLARESVGGFDSPAAVSSRASAPERLTEFAGGERASLVGFARPDGATRLAWRVETHDRDSHLYVVVVDAETGRILARRGQTFFEEAAHVWNFHPDQTRSPLSVDLGADPSWIDRSDGGTRLRGNNAHALIELDFPTTQEVAQSGGDWIFPMQFFNHAGCPTFGCTWEDAAPGSTIPVNREGTATQAFYLTNRFHDYLLSPPIGFDDASGNLEHVSTGGVGGDAVDVAASMRRSRQFQAFAATTELDGSTAFMTFGRWHPPYEVHSGNSADIVYHEYSHLLTVRLLSPGVQGTNQSVAMAEGWSDFFAMDLLVHEGEVTDTSFDGEVFFGSYVEQAGGVFGPEPGLRNQAIDCPVDADADDCPGSVNAGTGGFTYGDYGNVGGDPAEVHDNGEIWGQTLWDLRERLGRDDALALIVGGLRLAPSHPSFLDMRDAIVLQARVLGMPTRPIWEVFAGRGMGRLADDGGSGNSLEPTEDFSLPQPLEHVRTAVADPAPGGDGDGVADPGETLRIRQRLENVTNSEISGVSGTLSAGGPGIAIGTRNAVWPSIAPGAQAENSQPFSATIPFSQPCGTAADFSITVSAPTGAPTIPPLSVPVGGPAFTDSADVPKVVPDPGEATSVLSGLPGGTVRDLDVRLGRLDHTFVGELKLTLSHGSTTVVLMDNPGEGTGATGDAFANVVLDDEAALPIESLPLAVPRGDDAYSGSYRPDEALDAFDGQPTEGDWTLTVDDTAPNDSGTLVQWGISAVPDCATTVQRPPARDGRPPQTRITAGPRRVAKPIAKFAFAADEPNARFECRLRGSEARRSLRRFRACRSPKRYRKLDPGRYTFAVLAVDAAGNRDPSPATRRFRVKAR